MGIWANSPDWLSMICLGDPKRRVRDVKRFAQALAHDSGVRGGELSTRPQRDAFRETIWIMGEERPRNFRQPTGSTKEGECAVPNSHSPSFFIASEVLTGVWVVAGRIVQEGIATVV